MKKLLHKINEYIWYKHFHDEDGKLIYHIVEVQGIRTFLVDGPGGQRSTITPLIKIGRKVI